MNLILLAFAVGYIVLAATAKQDDYKRYYMTIANIWIVAFWLTIIK